MLLETEGDMRSLGITQEQRCGMMKCHAYCARRSFDSCREIMFEQACEASNPHLYSCDVRCNGAIRHRPLGVVLAVSFSLTFMAAVSLGWVPL